MLPSGLREVDPGFPDEPWPADLFVLAIVALGKQRPVWTPTWGEAGTHFAKRWKRYNEALPTVDWTADQGGLASPLTASRASRGSAAGAAAASAGRDSSDPSPAFTKYGGLEGAPSPAGLWYPKPPAEVTPTTLATKFGEAAAAARIDARAVAQTAHDASLRAVRETRAESALAIEALKAHLEVVVAPAISATGQESVAALAAQVEARLAHADGAMQTYKESAAAAVASAERRTDALATQADARFGVVESNLQSLNGCVQAMSARLETLVEFIQSRPAGQLPAAGAEPADGTSLHATILGPTRAAATGGAARTIRRGDLASEGWKTKSSKSAKGRKRRQHSSSGGSDTDSDKDLSSGSDDSDSDASARRMSKTKGGKLPKGLEVGDKQVWLHYPTVWRQLVPVGEKREGTLLRLRMAFEKWIVDPLAGREKEMAKKHWILVEKSLRFGAMTRAEESDLRETVLRWAVPVVFGPSRAATMIAELTMRKKLPADVFKAAAATIRRTATEAAADHLNGLAPSASKAADHGLRHAVMEMQDDISRRVNSAAKAVPMDKSAKISKDRRGQLESQLKAAQKALAALPSA